MLVVHGVVLGRLLSGDGRGDLERLLNGAETVRGAGRVPGGNGVDDRACGITGRVEVSGQD